MIRIFAGAVLALLMGVSLAFAADNNEVPVCNGTTSGACAVKQNFANKDIAGVKFPQHIPYNSSGTELFTSGNAGYVRAASGGFASGSIASGAVASGAIASGAVASGALAVGAGADGWDVTKGAKADSVCGSDTGTCGIIALLKKIAANTTTVNTSVGDGTIAVGTAGTAATDVVTIQGIASMTPIAANISQINGVTPLMGAGNTGTGSPRVTLSTDQVAIATWGLGATGATAPTGAQLAGFQSGANMVAGIQASASVKIDMSTATTTQLVALSGSTKIYVTAWDATAGGTTTFKLVYGTGTNCGTGTTDLTAAYPWTAQAGLTKGSGHGPVLVVPAGNALCGTNSAAQQVSGSLAYTQF